MRKQSAAQSINNITAFLLNTRLSNQNGVAFTLVEYNQLIADLSNAKEFIESIKEEPSVSATQNQDIA